MVSHPWHGAPNFPMPRFQMPGFAKVPTFYGIAPENWIAPEGAPLPMGTLLSLQWAPEKTRIENPNGLANAINLAFQTAVRVAPEAVRWMYMQHPAVKVLTHLIELDVPIVDEQDIQDRWWHNLTQDFRAFCQTLKVPKDVIDQMVNTRTGTVSRQITYKRTWPASPVSGAPPPPTIEYLGTFQAPRNPVEYWMLCKQLEEKGIGWWSVLSQEKPATAAGREQAGIYYKVLKPFTAKIAPTLAQAIQMAQELMLNKGWVTREKLPTWTPGENLPAEPPTGAVGVLPKWLQALAAEAAAAIRAGWHNITIPGTEMVEKRQAYYPSGGWQMVQDRRVVSSAEYKKLFGTKESAWNALYTAALTTGTRAIEVEAYLDVNIWPVKARPQLIALRDSLVNSSSPNRVVSIGRSKDFAIIKVGTRAVLPGYYIIPWGAGRKRLNVPDISVEAWSGWHTFMDKFMGDQVQWAVSEAFPEYGMQKEPWAGRTPSGVLTGTPPSQARYGPKDLRPYGQRLRLEAYKGLDILAVVSGTQAATSESDVSNLQRIAAKLAVAQFMDYLVKMNARRAAEMEQEFESYQDRVRSRVMSMSPGQLRRWLKTRTVALERTAFLSPDELAEWRAMRPLQVSAEALWAGYKITRRVAQPLTAEEQERANKVKFDPDSLLRNVPLEEVVADLDIASVEPVPFPQPPPVVLGEGLSRLALLTGFMREFLFDPTPEIEARYSQGETVDQVLEYFWGVLQQRYLAYAHSLETAAATDEAADFTEAFMATFMPERGWLFETEGD